jgi:hypothetical protein
MKTMNFCKKMAAVVALVAAASMTARAQATYDSRMGGGPNMAGVEGRGMARDSGYQSRGAAAIPQMYNMKVGPIYLRTEAGVSFEYNDNITLRDDDKESDFITTPRVMLGLYVPLTRDNGLRLNLDLGGTFYAENSQYNNFFLSPAGGNSFEFYAETKNWQFRVRDNFNLSTSPIVYGQSQDQEVRLFQNDILFAADGDYNKLVLGASYGHGLVYYFTSNFDDLSSQSDRANAYVGVKMSENLILGLNYDISYTYYAQDRHNDGWYQGLSAYAQFVLSPYLNGRISAGYGASAFEDKGKIDDQSDFGNLILAGVLNHTINNYLRHAFTITKAMTPAVDSNFSDTWDLNYNLAWDIGPNLTLGIPLGWTHITTSGGRTYEEADLYRAGISTSYQLSKRLNLTASYQYSRRDSEIEGSGFSQNVFRLGLLYSF